MEVKIIDNRPTYFDFNESGEVVWSKTADHDNDRWLRAMEHLSNAYDLLKDQVTSLQVEKFMFGNEVLFITLR